MSFVTEVSRIKDAKEALRNTIITKHVLVPQNATLDKYPSYISRIPVQGAVLPLPSNVSDMVLDEYGHAIEITYNENKTSIGMYEFSYNTHILSVIAPNVTSIGQSAFRYSAIKSITMPSVTAVGVNGLSDCAIEEINLPSVVSFESEACRTNMSLVKVDLGESVTSIGPLCFYECSALTTVICRATTPPTLGGDNVFKDCNENLVIYVPSSSVNAYMRATNWSTYSRKIQAIPQ